MNIIIEAPFEITAAKDEYLKSTLAELINYLGSITQINLFFKIGEGTGEQSVLAEIRVRIPGKDIFVENRGVNDIVAFEKAFEAVKRQVKKKNDKNNDHRSDVKELNDLVNDNVSDFKIISPLLDQPFSK